MFRFSERIFFSQECKELIQNFYKSTPKKVDELLEKRRK